MHKEMDDWWQALSAAHQTAKAEETEQENPNNATHLARAENSRMRKHL